jgi:hypothetical protein
MTACEVRSVPSPYSGAGRSAPTARLSSKDPQVQVCGRHSNAYVGGYIKIVSDTLGHSDTRITRDIYQNVRPQVGKSAAEATARKHFHGIHVVRLGMSQT